MSRPLALAVDFGGTKVEAALVDDHGTVVPGTRHRQPTGPHRTSEQLATSVRTAVGTTHAALPTGASLAGVGVGAAGELDDTIGTVSPLNLPAWRGYPLGELIAQIVPAVPITLRIDGLCIALAEHWVGAGRGARNMIGMIVSTGVGGGLIIEGRGVRGPTGNAGHIGHVEVGGMDDPCACGGHGCLEAVASGPKTVAWARARGFTGDTGEDLGRAHAAGDPVALAAVERAGRALGRALASTTNLLDLDVAAIGGGFSRVSPALFEHARNAHAERTTFAFPQRLQIVPSALSDEGPLIGAASLVHRPDAIG
ncbi:MAG: sugar kinase [Candidatus Lumbricidophila eiseniae]|uniref:Sugar kinase n=1 Tax=Candidatus Lumbricidiphila eiseniae TaxID=1969409 RepID=A0A2A6FTV4_9MICO|nr:MAG: sugar kinase [Candidatus Lumbricidophila eiseniae]